MRSLETKRFKGRTALLACLLFGALFAVLRGRDGNWDLKNYHLYNAWAMLHDRLTLDLDPAGMQSFFNPLLDVPYFLLGIGPLQHLPRLLEALQGFWYGGLIYVLLQIAIALAELRERKFGTVDLLAVLIGATGTMVMSQAGKSSNEVPLALLILSGVYLLLPLCGDRTASRPLLRLLLAGLLCGLAAGLKPTAVVYVPALGLALLFALGATAAAWRMTMLFAAATIIGFVLGYGWWGWQLYGLTGNPVFPMFNQVFHSSWVPATSETDRQFMPRNVGQWLFYPFYWIGTNHRLVTEGKFADGRYALEMIAVLVLAVNTWKARARPASGSRTTILLAVFVTLAYVSWLCLFSILRYAVSIEVLSGLMLLLALQTLPNAVQADGTPRRWLVRLMAGLFVVLVAFGRYPGWGGGPYADVTFDIHPPAIEPNSLVLVIGQPQAYVIPFLNDAPSHTYVGLTWFDRRSQGYRLAELTRERIVNYHGLLYVLRREPAGDDIDSLQRILPGAQMTDCRPVQSNLEYTKDKVDAADALQLCRIKQG